MRPLTLEVRTPTGVVLTATVDSIVAEDETGWFGVRPGRADLVAVLPPGLLAYNDEDGEGFVALSGGLMGMWDDRCRVIALEATPARDLATIATEVARLERQRGERAEVHRGVVHDLAKEALRRLLGGDA